MNSSILYLVIDCHLSVTKSMTVLHVSITIIMKDLYYIDFSTLFIRKPEGGDSGDDGFISLTPFICSPLSRRKYS